MCGIFRGRVPGCRRGEERILEKRPWHVLEKRPRIVLDLAKIGGHLKPDYIKGQVDGLVLRKLYHRCTYLHGWISV